MVFEGIPFGSRYDVLDQKLANAGFEVKGNFIQHDDGQTDQCAHQGDVHRFVVHVESVLTEKYALLSNNHLLFSLNHCPLDTFYLQ